jgi:hypothetical protein
MERVLARHALTASHGGAAAPPPLATAVHSSVPPAACVELLPFRAMFPLRRNLMNAMCPLVYRKLDAGVSGRCGTTRMIDCFQCIEFYRFFLSTLQSVTMARGSRALLLIMFTQGILRP